MADHSAAWTLDRIEPPDNTFRDAGEDVHRAFWHYIAAIGVDRFHWRCNMGLGANGQPLTGIAESTRARGRKRSYTGLGNANNPPLVPALGLSRTEALLKGRGFVDHAEWDWTVDPITGLYWGQVMLWHAAGGGGRYPARNVIGWSREDVLWLHRQGGVWWYAHQHGVKVAQAMNELETRADKLPRVPGILVGKFKVTGRVDVEHFTFGIGGTEQMVRRSIEEGFSSGFEKVGRYRPPGGPKGGKAKPSPPTVPMKPKPVPAPAAARRRPAAVAQPAIGHPSGFRFGPAPFDVADETVYVDVARINAALSTSTGHGSSNPTPEAYARAVDMLSKAKADQAVVYQPRITIDSRGNPVIEDGRHRFAALRDQGIQYLPISVPKRQAAQFRRAYGAVAAPIEF